MKTLSPEENLRLIKLHKTWPDRDRFVGAPGEALLFHKWLKKEYPEIPVVSEMKSVDVIKEFLAQYRHTLKPVEKKEKVANLRREPRIENQVSVLMKVKSCPTDISAVGRSSHGKTLDLGLHGLRIRSSKEFPEDSEIDITITPKGFPLTLYSLIADPKWTEEQYPEFLMGFSLKESKDFERWQKEFGLRFASKAARIS